MFQPDEYSKLKQEEFSVLKSLLKSLLKGVGIGAAVRVANEITKGKNKEAGNQESEKKHMPQGRGK